MTHEINHPLLKHKMTLLRDINTDTNNFRSLSNEITKLIAYEALKNVELDKKTVKTPLCDYNGSSIKNDIIFIPILRAGIGMLDGVLDLVPDAKVGFVGMFRDHNTKKPVTYYEKLPENTKDPVTFIIDPMLATGGSIIATIDLLKKENLKNIHVISIISSPEGLKAIESTHPDVDIFTGCIDEYLDENKYIIPGLGDAGDRLFGTE